MVHSVALTGSAVPTEKAETPVVTIGKQNETVSVESIAKIIRRAMHDHSTPATIRSERAAREIAERMGATLLRACDTDPMERLTSTALRSAGIEFITDHDPSSPAGLDFYLPRFDVHIEVKRFHSDRVMGQLRRANDVILLQGARAVEFFAALTAQEAATSTGEQVGIGEADEPQPPAHRTTEGGERTALARKMFAEVHPHEDWDAFEERYVARGNRHHPMQAKAFRLADIAIADLCRAPAPQAGEGGKR